MLGKVVETWQSEQGTFWYKLRTDRGTYWVKENALRQTAENWTPDAGASEYNFDRVEAKFIEYLNEERQSRDLQTVSERNALTRMARDHSEDMAVDDYFQHTEPDGDTLKDRFVQNDLWPECAGVGTENIAIAAPGDRIRVKWQQEPYVVNNENELAYFLFQQWLHSPPHRRNMMKDDIDETGLGLAVQQSSNDVYATQNTC
jgi:uncharacterized protein YkwD